NGITCALMFSLAVMPVHAVDFNTDILDAEDKQNIDISRFSQAGYIMPGEYQMDIRVNDQGISPSAFLVKFLEPSASGTDEKKLMPQACLTPEVVQRIGLTPASLDKVTYWNNGQCADFSRLPGVEIRPNPAEGMLYINMPQAWLEYSDASWLPPSRWDNGIPGLLFDYNINGTVNRQHIRMDGMVLSGAGDNVLKTTGANSSTLGVALYQGSDVNNSYPLRIGAGDQGKYGYKITRGLTGQNTATGQFTFTAVPWKLGGRTLNAGKFSAVATMSISYL
ncbi:fimbrial protein, partial [Escherichia coli]